MTRPKRETEKVEDLVWKDLAPYIILALLEKEPMHGYGVKKKILEMSHAKMGSTTIYAIIYSLMKLGLVEGVWQDRRKVYKLTDKGKYVLDISRKAISQTITA